MTPPDGSARPSPPVLLIGHGTREAAGTAQFLETARRFAARFPGRRIRPCFLELAEPSIPQAVAALRAEYGDAALKAGGLTAVPLLLFAAGHAKVDIPTALRECAADIPYEQTSALELHPKILELSARRFRAAIAGPPVGSSLAGERVDPQDTLLLFIGRGARDPEAAARFREFAELRRRLTPVGGMRLGYMAIDAPDFRTALAEAAADRFGSIVVQPHFLFSGVLSRQLDGAIEQAALRHPRKVWRGAEPLGIDDRLLDCLADLVARGERRPGGRAARLRS